MVSLKGEDVDRITLCLYSHNIISESLRNMILVPRHSEHERMINLLCHMETKIKQSPNVFMQIVEIFTEELQLGRVATLLETQYRKYVSFSTLFKVAMELWIIKHTDTVRM